MVNGQPTAGERVRPAHVAVARRGLRVQAAAVGPGRADGDARHGPGPSRRAVPAAGDLLVGAAEGDDAAVLRLDEDRALVLTTDFFTPIVDDPRDWGRVAATNAMSDVYAMGGKPVIAVNLTAWPGETFPVEMLADVLRGGAEAAAAAGCLVVGGHTIDDPEPKYGLAVVGMADPRRLMTVDRARDGDVLILTKPIGTGVVATAHKRGAAPPEVLAAAVTAMTTLNAAASEAALHAGAVAATDVTGFGPAGLTPARGISASMAGLLPVSSTRPAENGVPRLIRNRIGITRPASAGTGKSRVRPGSARPCPVLSAPLVRVRRGISARHGERGPHDLAG